MAKRSSLFINGYRLNHILPVTRRFSYLCCPAPTLSSEGMEDWAISFSSILPSMNDGGSMEQLPLRVITLNCGGPECDFEDFVVLLSAINIAVTRKNVFYIFKFSFASFVCLKIL